MHHTIRQINRLKNWFHTYERLLMPGTLLFGVIVDAVTFTSIDVWTAFTLLCVYIVIAGLAIGYINAYEAGQLSLENKKYALLRIIAPFVIQFTFGALLSACFIFYAFSGSILASWPFILILVVLMVGNELFRKYYLNPTVQISIYYFILLTFISIVLPFVLKSISIWVFFAAGLLSVFLILLYLHVLYRNIPTVQILQQNFVCGIAAVLIVVNILYFFNFIPPIPLSIRDTAIAHDIIRQEGEYVLQVEHEYWWQKLVPGKVVHMIDGGRVYVYTAIFAPGDLNTNVIHHWQYFDTATRTWTTQARASYTIRGGRDGGYRGYSLSNRVRPGKWRVDVETERGQVIGRVRFSVAEESDGVMLEQVTR